uniref:uncharacterized protein LOC101293942 isoform X1 n=1 Tax=Fragaria vesca subsp. vesca TaxID=101020 RepID=UPI0005CB6C84|nr:PREDICTED: uncharacterized protein LOC101293942 isoform X1 [Fragaria vesca subsp. vesca]
MEYNTQQLVDPEIEENPLECDYLGYHYQDPLPNTTSMFEAPQIDHGFNSVALPLPEDNNQIPHMGFQGLEDFSLRDYTALDIANTFSSSPLCDFNNVLDGKTHTTVLESFGESSNDPSDMMIGSSGFSSTQCDSVLFDEKPISTMVDSFDYLINNSTNLGYHAMIESSGFSSSLCDSLVFDDMLLREMVESLNNNVPSDVGQHEVSMMVESSRFSSTQCDSVVFDEKPISTMVDSFDYLINNSTNLGHHAMIESSGFSSSLCDSLVFDEMLLREIVESLNNNVPSDVGQHEVSMMVGSSGFSSTQCDSVVFDEKPISTIVESFGNSSNVPSVFDHHEASMVTESSAAYSSSHCNALVLYETPLSTIVDSFDYSDMPTPDLSDEEVSVKIESGYPSWGTSDTSCLRGTSNRGRCSTQMKIKSDALELEGIKQYFNLPITKAAKELKVGVTLLKRRCRELNIMRWPHRKIKSLNSLIETMKRMGLRNEVKMLEENKRLLELVPNMELTKRTKRLRQSIFKANYNKKKMSLSISLG